MRTKSKNSKTFTKLNLCGQWLKLAKELPNNDRRGSR